MKFICTSPLNGSKLVVSNNIDIGKNTYIVLKHKHTGNLIECLKKLILRLRKSLYPNLKLSEVKIKLSSMSIDEMLTVLGKTNMTIEYS